MTPNLLYSILGVCGGMLCAAGDMLLDIKGKDNVKCGESRLIESNWIRMSAWRFRLSILLAMVGVFFYSLGMYALGTQIGVNSEPTGHLMVLCSILSAMSGFFRRSFICVAPLVYKKALETSDAHTAEQVVVALFDAIKLPFFLLFALLLLGPTAITVYAILQNLLEVPRWFVLLNPVVFLLVGVSLRLLKRDWFYELPSIIMPSLGLSMFGVIGIVNLW